MTDSGLSENVKKFIVDHINSVEQLEVLLLLHSHKQKDWNAQEVSQELRINQDSAKVRLADLHSRGLLTMTESSDPRYKYQPQKSDFIRTVDDLAKAYPDYRVTVINLIFSKPIDKIRTFADAFKFREDD